MQRIKTVDCVYHIWPHSPRIYQISLLGTLDDMNQYVRTQNHQGIYYE